VQRVGRVLRPRPGKRAYVYELAARATTEMAQVSTRRRGLVGSAPKAYAGAIRDAGDMAHHDARGSSARDGNAAHDHAAVRAGDEAHDDPRTAADTARERAAHTDPRSARARDEAAHDDPRSAARERAANGDRIRGEPDRAVRDGNATSPAHGTSSEGIARAHAARVSEPAAPKVLRRRRGHVIDLAISARTRTVEVVP
jgi:superfamily II DNA or RNA helicase